jgi:hypothetical protein
MSHRWMKFWPQDWQSDPGLRSCSMAARGLWIECIAIMHRAEPYGHLSVNGVAPTAKRLAGMVGATEREVERLMAELAEAGVYSVTPEGTIYSRRMVRDARLSEEGREAVTKRWANKGNDAKPNTPPNRVPTREPDSPPSSLEAEADTEAEKNPPTPRKRGSAKSHPDFPDFWAAYPRKVGRGAAEKAFAKAIEKGASVGDIAAGLNRQAWPDNPRFIPHPATWLNQGRWQDDPAAAAPPAAEPPSKIDWLIREMAAERSGDFPDFNAPPLRIVQ